MSILTLLQSLKKQNEKDSFQDKYSNHIVKPSNGIGNSKIATLEDGLYKNLSPMLKERFEFAGEWVEATAGITWLELEKINNSKNNKLIKEQINLRIENWDGTIFDQYEFKDITIFGLDENEYYEVYLVWENELTEPCLYEFRTAQVNKFRNLQEYIEYWLGDESKVILSTPEC